MSNYSKPATSKRNQLLHRALAVELTPEELGEIGGAQTGRYFFTGCSAIGNPSDFAGTDVCAADYGRDND
jgi:hypothetical protein